MDMMTRRRAMIGSGGAGPLPEWDVEWTYEDGLPTETGWEKETQGTTTEVIDTTFLKVTASGKSGNYIRYKNDDYLVGTGVLEVRFRGASSNNIYFIISISNGNSGLSVRAQYTNSYKGIYLGDNASLSGCTKIASFSAQTACTVRLVIDNGYGQVYVNDSLVAPNIDLSTIVINNDMTRFQFNCASTGNVTGRFYSVRLKLGRTS